MKTLANILKERKNIIELVEKLGFSNPRIFNEGDSFNLLVSVTPTGDSHLCTALEVKLMEQFQYACRVCVLVESRLKEIFKEARLASAVPLQDDNEIKRAFNNDPNNITYPDLRLEQGEQDGFYEVIELANEILNCQIDSSAPSSNLAMKYNSNKSLFWETPADSGNLNQALALISEVERRLPTLPPEARKIVEQKLTTLIPVGASSHKLNKDSY